MKNLARALQAKAVRHARRKHRVNTAVKSTASLPRLVVNKSNLYIYAQVIDDTQAVTVASASTNEKEAKGKGYNVEAASDVGKKIAERAIAKGIKQVMFDRGGYIYHGRIKALADAARASGLEF